jgi:hypothetical protein
MTGVFVSKGMSVVVPAGGLVLSFDNKGKLSGGSATIHVHFEVCPTWLGLALGHLETAKASQTARALAWEGADENAKGATLEREFEASMQAIMSAAIAWEAFYAVVSSKITIPQELRACWRKNRTARYRQVSEVLRMAFNLTPTSAKALREKLEEIYRLRDQAVHPTGEITAPVHHPELGVRVEWRFVDFRYQNAAMVVQETVRMMCELVTAAKPKLAVQTYAEAIRPTLQGLEASIADITIGPDGRSIEAVSEIQDQLSITDATMLHTR